MGRFILAARTKITMHHLYSNYPVRVCLGLSTSVFGKHRVTNPPLTPYITIAHQSPPSCVCAILSLRALGSLQRCLFPKIRIEGILRQVGSGYVWNSQGRSLVQVGGDSWWDDLGSHGLRKHWAIDWSSFYLIANAINVAGSEWLFQGSYLPELGLIHSSSSFTVIGVRVVWKSYQSVSGRKGARG